MKYYGIATLLYLINLIIAISMMFGSQANSIILMTSVNELFLLWKSPIQAIFKFLMPGLLYYQACIYFQQE